jgi:uncharacterized coiled-coil protein SlyX
MTDIPQELYISNLNKWIDKQHTEIERLRAALTDMLKHFKQYEDAECCKRVYAQARRALEPKHAR